MVKLAEDAGRRRLGNMTSSDRENIRDESVFWLLRSDAVCGRKVRFAQLSHDTLGHKDGIAVDIPERGQADRCVRWPAASLTPALVGLPATLYTYSTRY